MTKTLLTKKTNAARSWLTNYNNSIKDTGVKMSEAPAYNIYKRDCQEIKDHLDLPDWKAVNAYLLTGTVPMTEEEYYKQYS
jgi:hypothetical protein